MLMAKMYVYGYNTERTHDDNNNAIEKDIKIETFAPRETNSHTASSITVTRKPAVKDKMGHLMPSATHQFIPMSPFNKENVNLSADLENLIPTKLQLINETNFISDFGISTFKWNENIAMKFSIIVFAVNCLNLF